MRRSFFAALIVATTLVIFAVPAGAQAPGQPDWKESFRLHDKNGDGRIDRAEFQEWMEDVFFFRDTNHKGYLVQSDMQGMVSSEVFKAMNRKGDGKLTMQEFLNALFKDFDAIDVPGDGFITIAEVEAYIRRK